MGFLVCIFIVLHRKENQSAIMTVKIDSLFLLITMPNIYFSTQKLQSNKLSQKDSGKLMQYTNILFSNG